MDAVETRSILQELREIESHDEHNLDDLRGVDALEQRATKAARQKQLASLGIPSAPGADLTSVVAHVCSARAA